MTSVKNEIDMKALGERIGQTLRGGEVIELVGDVGAGKTTLVKGIGVGLGVGDDIQSPSFTISRIYDGRDGLQLHHYDFYRLSDAGVMSFELAESVGSGNGVTVVEWADTVRGILPADCVRISIQYTPQGDGRIVTVDAQGTDSHIAEVVV
ncbi:tRNA (adenosine(37)-N6)-threonylcarbamoyltransferase complex ATPase subunit type 1 TsaE [Patescibacteria group bacterium]|nr:MAG: tRNA (adenosine(37)-N6)-threonylcarbamoyltransferase complex ATPase subunit type 1 TsaE [Patescibacteria group bacterium]